MIYPDIGSITSDNCALYTALPVACSSVDNKITVVMRSANIQADTIESLQFVIGRVIQCLPLPDNEKIIASFEQTLRLAKLFMKIRQSADAHDMATVMIAMRESYEKFLEFFRSDTQQPS